MIFEYFKGKRAKLCKPIVYFAQMSFLIVQMIIAGVYIFVLMSNLFANEKTADDIAQQAAQTKFVESAASRVKLLLGQMQTKEHWKMIEKAYDAIHSSPIHSCAGATAAEHEILNQINSLETAVAEERLQEIEGIVRKILRAIEVRDRILCNGKL